MSPENISLEDAVNILSLPREIPIKETVTVELDPPPKMESPHTNFWKKN